MTELSSTATTVPVLDISSQLVRTPRRAEFPADLGQACAQVQQKLSTNGTLEGCDLHALNTSIFNVPEGQHINGQAVIETFLLLGKAHAQLITCTQLDALRREYIALLGTMQNQPFFSTGQRRKLLSWICEAVGHPAIDVDRLSAKANGAAFICIPGDLQSGMQLVDVCRSMLQKFDSFPSFLSAEDAYALNEAVFNFLERDQVGPFLCAPLLEISSSMHGAYVGHWYDMSDLQLRCNYLALLATLQNQNCFPDSDVAQLQGRMLEVLRDMDECDRDVTTEAQVRSSGRYRLDHAEACAPIWNCCTPRVAHVNQTKNGKNADVITRPKSSRMRLQQGTFDSNPNRAICSPLQFWQSGAAECNTRTHEMCAEVIGN